MNERGSSSTPDKSADSEAQLTIMNSRVIALMTQIRDYWSLAGDQLYIEMDISRNNLFSGNRLRIGIAVFKVSEKPHAGCKKFSERFGLDALKFVNSLQGCDLFTQRDKSQPCRVRDRTYWRYCYEK